MTKFSSPDNSNLRETGERSINSLQTIRENLLYWRVEQKVWHSRGTCKPCLINGRRLWGLTIINNCKMQFFMPLYNTFQAYVFNLHTANSAEAKRLWRHKIKEEWDWECAYCGSDENLTIDHIVPRAKGGTDFTKNCLCACHSCNQDKGYTPVEDWYLSQEFFDVDRYEKVKSWMEPEPTITLYRYGSRRNNCV